MINIKHIIKPLLKFCTPKSPIYNERISMLLSSAFGGVSLFDVESISLDEYKNIRNQLLLLLLTDPFPPVPNTNPQNSIYIVIQHVVKALVETKLLIDETIVRFDLSRNPIGHSGVESLEGIKNNHDTSGDSVEAVSEKPPNTKSLLVQHSVWAAAGPLDDTGVCSNEVPFNLAEMLPF